MAMKWETLSRQFEYNKDMNDTYLTLRNLKNWISKIQIIIMVSNIEKI